MGNELPLHATTHWRKIRQIYIRLMNYENCVGNYDLNKITCYRVQRGEELLCKNMSSTAGYAPFVYDNSYEVFEAPLKNEHKKYPITGNFLMLVHDTSFDYWMLIKLKHSITQNGIESVNYKPLGRYTIASTGSNLEITKDEYGYKLNYGGRIVPSYTFDSFNTRKKAYHFSAAKLLGKENGMDHKERTITGHEKVKKYHHNNHNSNNHSSGNGYHSENRSHSENGHSSNNKRHSNNRNNSGSYQKNNRNYNNW